MKAPTRHEPAFDFPASAELSSDPDVLSLAQRCGFALEPPSTPDTAH